MSTKKMQRQCSDSPKRRPRATSNEHYAEESDVNKRAHLLPVVRFPMSFTPGVYVFKG